MLGILVADDHPIVRRGIKQIITETPGMSVTGEAASGQEVLRRTRENDYDVVLLDISMPGTDGTDVIKQLRIEKPELHILVLSIHPEEQYAVRVLKAGASGYLTKESAPDELVTAIRKVAQGRKYVSPSLAERLALDLEVNTESPLHETLSDREYQVMCLIASGKTVTQIA